MNVQVHPPLGFSMVDIIKSARGEYRYGDYTWGMTGRVIGAVLSASSGGCT